MKGENRLRQEGWTVGRSKRIKVKKTEGRMEAPRWKDSGKSSEHGIEE